MYYSFLYHCVKASARNFITFPAVPFHCIIDGMETIGYTLFRDTELPAIALVCLAVSLLIWLFFSRIPFHEKEEEPVRRMRIGRPSRPKARWTRADVRNVCLITAVYAVVSLWKLGSPVFPTTLWQPSFQDDGQDVVFQLPEETAFDAVYALAAEGDNNSNPDAYQLGFHNITVYGSNDYETWDEIGVLNDYSIYQYSMLYGSWDYRYVWFRFISKNDCIAEIGLSSSVNGEHFIPVSVYADGGRDSKYPAELLIDEQDKLVLYPTYYDEGYFDEVYHPRNAWEIANGQYMYASVHPLLGTNLMALCIRLFGMSPLVWRIGGAVCGILMVPVMYALLKLLFAETVWCTAGTILLAGDFMHLTTSRIGTLEPYSLLFIMIMFWYMIRYFFTSFYDTPLKDTLKLLLICGIWTGIAIAAKWTACYGAVGLAIILFTNWITRALEYKKALAVLNDPEADEELRQEAEHIRAVFPKALTTSILLCFVFFIFIPAAIYWLSFLPDHIWRNDSWSIANIWKHSVSMYRYHADLEATHPYQSSWYMWIVDARPMWYYLGYDQNGYMHTISCFSNPLLTWVGLPASLYVFYEALRKRRAEAWIITVGILTALGPWVSFVQRCVFSYHYYPTSIFTAMAVICFFRGMEKKDVKWRNLLYAFLAVYVFLFVLFLPATAGFGTSQAYIKMLEWFPSWYFG